MPAINRTLTFITPLRSVLPFPTRHLSTTQSLYLDQKYNHLDFQSEGSGFSSVYEPNQPTKGPLSQASNHGAPRLTPSLLKEHLDKYVVGQDKAKKVTSVAIYNHYQRIGELRRQEAEETAKREQAARWDMKDRERNSHPVENDFPGHVETVDLNAHLRAPYNTAPEREAELDLGMAPLPTTTQTIIEKSNLLLLGPSGVGKTYIFSTLASILEVPFCTIDCSSLTQAGYIGTDIELSLERLLLAANHEVRKCEAGIIFFDEVDKLAKPAVMTHGRDVSGEGVQQGLLKMIEGTTVTVNAKSDRSSKTERLERGAREQQQSGKSEQYTIDTTNILFVFAGAFVGLERIITSRLSSGSSLGFGAELKTPAKSTTETKEKNILEFVQTTDLQSYGLIPELLGRIPITVALSPLNISQLVSILTEPRNSLVKQFEALFGTYGIQLKLSTGALHAIAERALPPSTTLSNQKTAFQGGGIGARGLRTILESVLAEVMFWGPGSAIRYCLVDEEFVRSQITTSPEAQDAEGAKMPRCWSRGQSKLFEDALENEEEAWKNKSVGNEEKAKDAENAETFEEFRRVGSSGM